MITRRASVTALVAVAVAGLASGCLSSNSGGGSSGGGYRIRPRQGHRRSHVRLRRRQRAGLPGGPREVRGGQRHHHQVHQGRVVGHRDPHQGAGGNPPDVGLFPQPGLMCDLAKQKKLIPYDAPTVATEQGDAGPGRHRGRHLCRRQGLRPAHRAERQERPVDRRAGVQGGRLHRPEDARRAAHPHARRSRPTARPRGASPPSPALPPAGRSPTGSRTSSCVSPARRTTTSGSRAS